MDRNVKGKSVRRRQDGKDLKGQAQGAQKRALRWCERMGLDVGADVWARLGFFQRILEDFSSAMNLVGSASAEAFFLGHVCDCLPVTLGLRPETRLVDVGSGGGFPGLVVACAQPDRDVVLVESRIKRAAFLTEAVRQLGLRRVRVLGGRFPWEDGAEIEGSRVDLVSRATFPAKRWLEVTEAGRQEGQCVLAMLSRDQFEELLREKVLAKHEDVRSWKYALPDGRARVLLRVCATGRGRSRLNSA